MSSKHWYRLPESGGSLTQDEIYQKALSHATSRGLQGNPHGSYIKKASWREYGDTVGTYAPSWEKVKVWIIAFSGEFVVWGDDTYPYMVMAFTLSGEPLSDGLYPEGNPIPFKVRP